MNNSELLRYISAYIKKWMDERSLTQIQASERLSINRGQLNGILNLNRGLSVEKLEAISYATGKNGLDALIEGRELLKGTSQIKSNDDGLTPEQRKALDAFKVVMIHGGEGAELLMDNAIKLAYKKQAEAEFENPTPTQISKSA